MNEILVEVEDFEAVGRLDDIFGVDELLPFKCCIVSGEHLVPDQARCFKGVEHAEFEGNGSITNNR